MILLSFRLSLQIEPPARKSLRVPSRPPPYPSFVLRSSKSSEDLLTPPLEPEYTGPDIATPPRRALTNHRSDAEIIQNKKAGPVAMAGIPLATRLQAKGVTLPANLDVSIKELKKASSKESETSSESRKVKSSSPSLQPKKRSHVKTQSLGNK